jgi:hypothetical protein
MPDQTRRTIIKVFGNNGEIFENLCIIDKFVDLTIGDTGRISIQIGTPEDKKVSNLIFFGPTVNVFIKEEIEDEEEA